MLVSPKQAVFIALFVQCCLCPGKSPASPTTFGINTRERSLSVCQQSLIYAGQWQEHRTNHQCLQRHRVLLSQVLSHTWGQTKGTAWPQSMPLPHQHLAHPLCGCSCLSMPLSALCCAEWESFSMSGCQRAVCYHTCELASCFSTKRNFPQYLFVVTV